MKFMRTNCRQTTVYQTKKGKKKEIQANPVTETKLSQASSAIAPKCGFLVTVAGIREVRHNLRLKSMDSSSRPQQLGSQAHFRQDLQVAFPNTSLSFFKSKTRLALRSSSYFASVLSATKQPSTKENFGSQENKMLFKFVGFHVCISITVELDRNKRDRKSVV